MFRPKRSSSGHHYKNSKNKLQCGTNEARDTGSHILYKIYIKLYKITGLVIHWLVTMSKSCIKEQAYPNAEMRFLKLFVVRKLCKSYEIPNHELNLWCTALDFRIFVMIA
jgi:hypothetical protein